MAKKLWLRDDRGLCEIYREDARRRTIMFGPANRIISFNCPPIVYIFIFRRPQNTLYVLTTPTFEAVKNIDEPLISLPIPNVFDRDGEVCFNIEMWDEINKGTIDPINAFWLSGFNVEQDAEWMHSLDCWRFNLPKKLNMEHRNRGSIRERAWWVFDELKEVDS